jgi:hypothetical protein
MPPSRFPPSPTFSDSSFKISTELNDNLFLFHRACDEIDRTFDKLWEHRYFDRPVRRREVNEAIPEFPM